VREALTLLPAVPALALGALGGVACLAPSTAQADIVMSPIIAGLPLTLPATAEGLYINVVTGLSSASVGAVPGWDLNPYGSSTRLLFYENLPMVYLLGFTPGSLDSGMSVGPASTFAGDYSYTCVFGSNPGEWDYNANNYFGFRFTDEADSLTHYGWGQIHVGAVAADRQLTALYYEDTAGTAIAVGATGVVPEPSSALLLAAGAAGLAAFRRRRTGA
jgi:hypothetical protein